DADTDARPRLEPAARLRRRAGVAGRQAGRDRVLGLLDGGADLACPSPSTVRNAARSGGVSLYVATWEGRPRREHCDLISKGPNRVTAAILECCRVQRL